ncbi:hypothetical protein D3C71_1630530 [compost metagenome]
MSQQIVDPLEAVQIQVQQHPGAAGALTARQQGFHGLVEPASVEQPGQGVGNRLELQLLVQVTHHRHVEHRHHHGLLLRWQWRTGERYRHLLTGCRAQDRIMHAPRFAPAVTAVDV